MQDLPKGADQQWLINARDYIQWLQEKVSRKQEYLKGVLERIEAAASRNLEAQELLNGEVDTI
jgi:hypothetical protein